MTELPADNSNLKRLSKAVEKFVNKQKSKISTSALRNKKSMDTNDSVPAKFTFLEESFLDHTKYASVIDYPFNDSDGYIEKP